MTAAGAAMRTIAYPLTIYYDASCPLCAREMHALKARDAGGRFTLTDCSAADFDERTCARDGITRDMMMACLHARDASGQWWSGLDVFEAAYRAAGLHLVARVIGSRRLRPILQRMYPWIAANRYALSRLGMARIFGRSRPADSIASFAQQGASCKTARKAHLQSRCRPEN